MFFDMGDSRLPLYWGTLAFMHTHAQGTRSEGHFNWRGLLKNAIGTSEARFTISHLLKNVLIEDHRAVGLELEDGSVHHV
jgi:hypothetical protein